MVQEGGPVMLDFQDARMGPCQYDLASLLRDSYIQLPETLVWKMVDRFLEVKQESAGVPLDREEFVRVFDFMSIQIAVLLVTCLFPIHLRSNRLRLIKVILIPTRFFLNHKHQLELLKVPVFRNG